MYSNVHVHKMSLRFSQLSSENLEAERSAQHVNTEYNRWLS